MPKVSNSNTTSEFHLYYKYRANKILNRLKNERQGIKDIVDKLDDLLNTFPNDCKGHKILKNKRKNYIIRLSDYDANIKIEHNRWRMPTYIYSIIIKLYFKLLLKELFKGYRFSLHGFYSKLGIISIMRVKNSPKTLWYGRKTYAVNWGDTMKNKQNLLENGTNESEFFNEKKVIERMKRYIKEGYTEEDSRLLAHLDNDVGIKYFKYHNKDYYYWLNHTKGYGGHSNNNKMLKYYGIVPLTRNISKIHALRKNPESKEIFKTPKLKINLKL